MSTSRRSGRGRWRAATPYLFLDAKMEKVRDGGRVVAKALVVAHAVHETGRREILSIDVGEAETEAFWTEFLRGLVKRGLTGVQLAISDAHAGLNKRRSPRSSGAPGSAAPSISCATASATRARTSTDSSAR
jgi:Transposase, Mutator family